MSDNVRFSTPGVSAASAQGLRHMFYPYDETQQYVSGVVAYIDQARADEASVIVAMPEDRRSLLHDALPNDDTVTFMDTAALGGNPSRLIPAWQDWISRRGREEVRGISEPVWHGRSAAQLSELRYHEWLLNLAFAETAAWSLLCPFDTASQPPEVRDSLARFHPLIWNGTESVERSDYAAEPYDFEPFDEPPEEHDEMAYALADLPTLRNHISGWSGAHGLPIERVRDLTLAASEIASNSIRHGGGSGTLRMWLCDDSLICQFSDAGVITNPLAGRVRPAATQYGGCGLWLAHQLCDLVEIRSDARDGTHVRLHMELPADANNHQPS